MNLKQLIEKYPIISDQITKNELLVIFSVLEKTLGDENSGAVVEFGCYAGTTSLFVRRLLNIYGSEMEFHVYDSFEGLPAKTNQDKSGLGGQFKARELAVSKKEFILNFKKAALKLPHIHKAWFSDLRSDDVPDNIKFAFLDGDFYESIKRPLELIEDKLGQSAVIVVDDYGNQALPGARQAVDEWASNKGLEIREEQSLAIIHV